MSRKEHAAINILESIAAEEAALAKIVHAEAEKIKLFIETLPHVEPKATVNNFIAFNAVVNRLLLTVLTKELLLLNKLDVAANLLSSEQPEPPTPPEPEEHHHHFDDPDDDQDEDDGPHFP